MIIGGVWDPGYSAAYYRAQYPLTAMEKLGHTVVSSFSGLGEVDLDRLATCDVVHVYRRFLGDDYVLLRQLVDRGIPIVWDNDDNFAATPEESPNYTVSGGEAGRKLFRLSVRTAKLAAITTVTTEPLAELYREAGVKRVEVIPNQLEGGWRVRKRHDGVVIGWIAGMEHMADAARLGVAEILDRLQRVHEDLRVECVGVDLALAQRYDYRGFEHFSDLPGRMAGYDIGIAPLADVWFNLTRSDIKVKEYAASGVPWVASHSLAYAGLGEKQGGMLVHPADWFDALDGLVRDPEARKRLGNQGRAWAKTQTIMAVARRWEAVYREAAGTRNPARRGAEA